MIEVLRAGATTVQDRGRPGLAHLGVPHSGALDPQALARANRLVGNAEDDAGLEALLRGPTLRFTAPALVALAGGEPEATLDGRAIGGDASFAVRAGACLDVGAVRRGARVYVAVRGGIAVDPVLMSRSTDQLTGLGPPPLRDGDRLPVGRPRHPVPSVALAAVAPASRVPVLRVVAGPGDDRFGPDALELLRAGPWQAGAQSNRVGLGLEGPALRLLDRGELLSEPTVPGAVQVPPSGRPILLLADAPTTGGYSVLAVVRHDDLRLAAQLRPGDPLRFA